MCILELTYVFLLDIYPVIQQIILDVPVFLFFLFPFIRAR